MTSIITTTTIIVYALYKVGVAANCISTILQYICICIGLLVSIGIVFSLCTIPFLDDETKALFKEHHQKFKNLLARTKKWCAIFFVLFTVTKCTSIVAPSQQELYIVAGAEATQQCINSKTGKSAIDKVKEWLGQ